MKKDIHPKNYIDCKVTCVCGNSFVTTSTLPSMQVDICSSCHPLFTGTQKLIDTEGRIDKFNKKVKRMEEKAQQHKERKLSAKDKKHTLTPVKQPTLKELMEQVKQTEEKEPTSAIQE